MGTIEELVSEEELHAWMQDPSRVIEWVLKKEPSAEQLEALMVMLLTPAARTHHIVRYLSEYQHGARSIEAFDDDEVGPPSQSLLIELLARMEEAFIDEPAVARELLDVVLVGVLTNLGYRAVGEAVMELRSRLAERGAGLASHEALERSQEIWNSICDELIDPAQENQESEGA